MPPVRAQARDRSAQIQRVLIGLFVANIVVVGAKFVIGLGIGSLAVLGDAVHASLDAMNNVVALTVIWFAARGPDEDHPYGHSKFETLGALGIVMFLSVSVFELVKGAVGRLVSGTEPLRIGEWELGLLVGTLMINTVVATYEARKGRELRSDLLLADAAHTKADVFVTLGVLIGVLLSQAGYAFVDPVVALLVAVVIVVIAYGIVSRTVPVLVDEHVVPSNDIKTVAEEIVGIVRAYDIRSRRSTDQTFAELTIAVDRHASVEQAHRLADSVEARLRSRLDLGEVVVHIEPC